MLAHSLEGASGRALRRRRGLESMPVILLLIFCTRPESVAGDDAAAPLPLAPCGSLSGVDDPLLLPPPKLFRSLFFPPAVDEDEEDDDDDDEDDDDADADSAAGGGESAVGDWCVAVEVREALQRGSLALPLAAEEDEEEETVP